jgi:tetratricopeptide (TPR) repeat protein
MAKRTRNHILEDKSRYALSKALPEGWIIRDKAKDYGIDCEVEIFNNNGYSTGLVFWVQLKATENSNRYNIRNIHFPLEKIIQFQSYQIPVMIVRYSMNENLLYYNWANDLTSQERNKEKIKIKFSEEKILNELDYDIIVDYLSKFGNIKQGIFSFPIPTYIKKNLVDSNLVTSSTTQFFKTIIQQESEYFKLVRNATDSNLQIIVGNYKIYLSLSDTNFSSIGYDISNFKEKNIEYFKDVLLSCYCILLYNSGKSEYAEKIFFDNSLIEILKTNHEFLINFLPHLLISDKCEEILDELNFMFDLEKDNSIQNISLAILMLARYQNPTKQDVFENFLQKQLKYSKARKYNLGIGITSYNLAGFYKNIGNKKLSLEFYLQARKFNKEYINHSYYNYEIAGLLFELKKYNFAARFYKKSIELKTEYKLAKALLADSYIYQGHYEKGVEILDKFLTEERDNDSVQKDEWYLKFLCFNSLIINDYPKSQYRQPDKALKELENKNIDSALEYDLLCSEAWLENGIRANKVRNMLETFLSFIMASLLCKEDPMLWVFATVAGFLEQGEVYQNSYHVIRLAYQYHNEKYIDLLYEYLSTNLPNAIDPVMSFVESFIKNIPKEDLTIRFFEDEKKYFLL